MEKLEKYYDHLFNYANFLTKNHHEAEDLTHDVFVIALEKKHLFDGKNLKSWLLTICRRRFINNYNRKKRIVFILSPFINGAEDKRFKDKKLDFDDIDEEIKEVILDLPKKFYETLILIADQYSYKETASILKVPIGTVMSRMNRIKERFN